MVAALITDTGQGERAWARLASDADQGAPDFIDLEILFAVRSRLGRGQLSQRRADQAVSGLADLPLVRYRHLPLVPRIWELRHNLTPYDAAYVALAEALDAPLVTLDARLANAPGPRCTIELLA